jgi:hypothetical protein
VKCGKNCLGNFWKSLLGIVGKTCYEMCENRVTKYGRSGKERYEKHVIKGGKNMLGKLGSTC